MISEQIGLYWTSVFQAWFKENGYKWFAEIRRTIWLGSYLLNRFVQAPKRHHCMMMSFGCCTIFHMSCVEEAAAAKREKISL